MGRDIVAISTERKQFPLMYVRYLNPVQATDKTFEAVERLQNDVGISQVPLREFHFTEQDVEHTAKWAMNDISRESNPRNISAEQIKELMRSCI